MVVKVAHQLDSPGSVWLLLEPYYQASLLVPYLGVFAGLNNIDSLTFVFDLGVEMVLYVFFVALKFFSKNSS